MNSITKESLSCVYFPLRLAFGLVPLLAGLDKFVGLLADWGKYLPSLAADVLPVSPANFMMVVGVIEIVAGLTVLTVLPRLGAYVVMTWLILIALTLVISGYYDVAVRDLVMAVAAFSLGQIARLRGEAWFPGVGVSKHATSHAAA